MSEYAPSLQKKIPSIVSARKSYELNLGDAKQIIELERSNVSGNSLKKCVKDRQTIWNISSHSRGTAAMGEWDTIG